MLNILIVDDEKSKIEKIISVINELGVETFIETAVDVKTTEAKLLEVQFDILILDLYIPTEYGKMDEKPENARDLMDHIRVDDDIFKPYFVIGNTGREDTEESHIGGQLCTSRPCGIHPHGHARQHLARQHGGRCGETRKPDSAA